MHYLTTEFQWRIKAEIITIQKHTQERCKHNGIATTSLIVYRSFSALKEIRNICAINFSFYKQSCTRTLHFFLSAAGPATGKGTKISKQQSVPYLISELK